MLKKQGIAKECKSWGPFPNATMKKVLMKSFTQPQNCPMRYLVPTGRGSEERLSSQRIVVKKPEIKARKTRLGECDNLVFVRL